jgi:hypothetical protein
MDVVEQRHVIVAEGFGEMNCLFLVEVRGFQSEIDEQAYVNARSFL